MSTTFYWTGVTDANWATTTNWTPTGPPSVGGGDSAIFDQNAVGSVNGSDQSATTLASLTILQTFGSGTILFGSNGTPLKVNVSGAVRIGDTGDSPAPAVGAQRINLDLATSAPVVDVVQTSASAIDAGKAVCRLRFNNASAVLNVIGGSVGVATDNYTDTATIGSVNASGGTVDLGAGCTLTNVVCNGGTIAIRSAATLVNVFNGTVNTYGTWLLATATLEGGILQCQHRAASGSSITTLNLRGGTLDTSQAGSAFVIGTTNLRLGSIVSFSDTQITYSAVAIDMNSKTNFQCQVG
jgi:hypothetical protein